MPFFFPLGFGLVLFLFIAAGPGLRPDTGRPGLTADYRPNKVPGLYD